MKANNARLYRQQEQERHRNAGDLECGLNPSEPSSSHGGITGVTQLGGSRAVHVSPPQIPPPAYVRHSECLPEINGLYSGTMARIILIRRSGYDASPEVRRKLAS